MSPHLANEPSVLRLAANSRTRTTGAPMKTKQRLRFAVIGQGYFAQAAVLPAFEEAVWLRAARDLLAATRRSSARSRRKYGVAAALGYDEYDDYLRCGEVDADLHRVAERHARTTTPSAPRRAGVHVLCEKPIATEQLRRRSA